MRFFHVFVANQPGIRNADSPFFRIYCDNDICGSTGYENEFG